MDVEGYEPLALRGMSELIRKRRPVIVSEFNPDGIRDLSNSAPEDYLQALAAHGYSLSIIELSGGELPMRTAPDIMQYWDTFRREHDESYGNIDIIARPEQKT